ncbi:MAG: hypothetical protein IJ217_05785 [Clostridia bacterium]|nr:hypothetical protein [Clostridia bacterium]
MDNASKALIMAGAILIAVMLISLGVLLYNRSAEQAESSIGTIEALGVTAFNEQFIPFLGTAVKGSSVKTLINKVQTNNANSDYTINLYTGATGTTALSSASSINNRTTYHVEETYDSTTGAIATIRVY